MSGLRGGPPPLGLRRPAARAGILPAGAGSGRGAAVLIRRSALAELIGAALLAKAGGAGHRTTAERLGMPPATVRGWIRRFAARADEVRTMATSLAHRVDPSLGRRAFEPRGSPFEDALEALGVAVQALARRLGPVACPWQAISGMSGGRLLAPTSAGIPHLA